MVSSRHQGVEIQSKVVSRTVRVLRISKPGRMPTVLARLMRNGSTIIQKGGYEIDIRPGLSIVDSITGERNIRPFGFLPGGGEGFKYIESVAGQEASCRGGIAEQRFRNIEVREPRRKLS